MNSLEDKYKIMFGAYLGITLLDEYELKPYVLKQIDDYIKEFSTIYPLVDFDYSTFMNKVDKEESNIVKLQDATRIGIILDFPIELRLLIKQKIKEYKNEENR